MRKIIHVDMDAFYGRGRRHRRAYAKAPRLVARGGHHTALGAVADRDRPPAQRRVVALFDRRMRLCAQLVFVPPRFEVYRAVSRQVHAIFADYTALIEPLGLDEAYLDVTEDRRGLSTATATAKEIRARIFDETGLTASAGISYNKFLAKLASAERKPNGQFVITPELGPDFIAALPVARFHGVGPVTAKKMQRLGIETGADLRAKSLAFLQPHFGKSAAWYLGIANGEDERPVIADRERKSSGSETTFERDLTAPDEIEAGVEAMANDVWTWCKKANAFGRTVTVKVKFSDFRQMTRSRSYPTAIARHDVLRQASVELVRTLLPTAKGVRLLGVIISNFGQAPADGADEPLLFGGGEAFGPEPDAGSRVAATGAR
jgi:DNA polymerase-4